MKCCLVLLKAIWAFIYREKKDFKSGFYFMSSAKLMKQTDTKHILAVQLYLV